MKDPNSSNCTSSYNESTSMSNMLSKIESVQTSLKSDQATIKSDQTTVKTCLTDPTDATCTAAYGGTSSIPSKLANKCETTTCATLTTEVSSLSKVYALIKPNISLTAGNPITQSSNTSMVTKQKIQSCALVVPCHLILDS